MKLSKDMQDRGEWCLPMVLEMYGGDDRLQQALASMQLGADGGTVGEISVCPIASLEATLTQKAGAVDHPMQLGADGSTVGEASVCPIALSKATSTQVEGSDTLGTLHLQEDVSDTLGTQQEEGSDTLGKRNLQHGSDTLGTEESDTLDAWVDDTLGTCWEQSEVAENDHTTIETRVSDLLVARGDGNLQWNGFLQHEGAENDHITIETGVSDSLGTLVDGNLHSLLQTLLDHMTNETETKVPDTLADAFQHDEIAH